MHTRLILSIDRRHDFATASSILDLALSLPDNIVGLDLCGDPAARPAGEIALFTPLFEKAREAGLGITVHFAEAESSASPEELKTLLNWRPHRLGHVICEDKDTKRGIALRKDELCLELCLSCNVHAGMVKSGFEGHHFGEWRAVEGVKVSLGVSFVPSSPSFHLTHLPFNDIICVMWKG